MSERILSVQAEQQQLEPSFSDVKDAVWRLANVAHRTPVMTSHSIDTLFGARIFFKCENLQRTGSFKFRGAYNSLMSLPMDMPAVAARASGNHGAAVALAANIRGLPAHIVMPERIPRFRRAAVAGCGAEMIFCAGDLAAHEAALADVVQRTGAAVIHAFDSAPAIAGHGTAVLELLQESCKLDLLVVPVGGGGLAAGAVLASRADGRGVRVLGVERAQEAASPRLRHLLQSSYPDTLADGLNSCLGRMPFQILARNVAAILSVDEYSILGAMRVIWERLKLVVEPSAAMPLAAVLKYRHRFAGLRLGLVLSGGNMDIDRLPWHP